VEARAAGGGTGGELAQMAGGRGAEQGSRACARGGRRGEGSKGPRWNLQKNSGTPL
jgi:hypothetical protein